MSQTVAARPRWQVIAATWVTEALAPIVLIVALLLLVAVRATGSLTRGLLLGTVAAAFAGGLPYAVLLFGVRSGRLGDRHLSRREQRPLMMALGLVSVSAGLGVMVLLDAPRLLYALVAAMVSGVAVALAVSSFWKISIHSACMAGTAAVLVLVFGAVGWLALPALALVMWGRLVLDAHTPAQVLAGAGVGAVVATGVMTVLR